MPDMLLLGPVSFQRFELPERIIFGGRQRLAQHDLPGGGRVIDVMGSDEAAVSWRGSFCGGDAAQRAQLLDVMRAQGASWVLTWDSFSYLVVVQSFTGIYERPNWVPYRISCAVLADQAQVVASLAASVSQVLMADLTTASGAIDTSAAAAALNAPGALSPGTAGYAAASSTLLSLQAGAAAQIASAGTALMAAPDAATAAAAAGQLAQFADANGYLGRASTTLADLG